MNKPKARLRLVHYFVPYRLVAEQLAARFGFDRTPSCKFKNSRLYVTIRQYRGVTWEKDERTAYAKQVAGAARELLARDPRWNIRRKSNSAVVVAFDHHGPAFDPDLENRFVTPDKIKAAREYVAERFPALADAPIVDSRVCQYENTSNGDFVIDRHPEFENVWFAGGGSGHGFKHGPAVGEYTAARVTGLANPPVEPRFSLASKGTEQHRSVY